MDHATDRGAKRELRSAFDSGTFDRDGEVKVNEDVGAASISPSGRDVVLASRNGLLVIDLDFLYSTPRRFSHHSRWDVADVQWSPFPDRAYWVVSTSNQKALVWNLESYSSKSPIEHVLHAHTRAITDINFSTHDPDMLATCAVDSFVHCWDLRFPARPAMTFADWNAGATQVKWNRQDSNIIASSHDKYLKIWDKRKGAEPLKTIEAHTTKIYGIDWNRTRLTGIATCSLDRTIKFWDYSQAYDEPERVIHTPYPVWRARHTPFGWGMLAMPQRGDYGLHLYDRRMAEDTPREGAVPPVKTYSGHRDNVFEFLWRYRGDVEGGIDNREFQLVSWGADKYLRLHRVQADDLKAVGYEKGKEARKGIQLVRSGAAYQSWRDEFIERQNPSQLSSNRTFKPQGLGALISLAGLSRVQTATAPSHSGQGFMTAYKTSSKPVKKTTSPMNWIEGVKIGEKPVDGQGTAQAQGVSETPESLSEEMKYVSNRYKKVTFEDADVHDRRAIVTLNGPWGKDGKNVFMRVSFDFPDDYPFLSRPEVRFERTHSGVPEEALRNLYTEVLSIMEHYRTKRRGCLEAVITYLLGEKDLQQSLLVKPHDGLDVPFTTPVDDDSSDEEAGVDADDLETSAVLPAQTNVPVRRTSGAVWAGNGQLVYFLLPKPEPVPAFSLTTLRTAEKGKTVPRQFENFGQLKNASIVPKERANDSNDGSDDSSAEVQTDTASSSSDESDDIGTLPARFQPPLAWRAAMLRNTQRPSSHSSSGVLRKLPPLKAKSVIMLADFTALLPSKRSLALDYMIFGDGPKVCNHNAHIAAQAGLDTLAAVWKLCEIILYNQVPLEVLDQAFRKDPILVMAKRNIVRIKRKDSGLDLGFDEPESIRNPKLTGRIKWGHNPLAGQLLIPRLFEHFENQGDIQMLAMLSCIFSEPAAKEGTQYALLNLRPEDKPITLKAPAFSLDYFPSKDVAWSQYHERKSSMKHPTTPLANPNGGDYFSRPLTTYGSVSSSNGPWAGDEAVISGPVTPFSNEHTPPVPLSRQTTVGSSLSTSPDPGSSRLSRRSQSSFSTALSHFKQVGLPFSLAAGSASPPVGEKPKLEPEISISAPSAGFLWGAGTSFTGTGSTSPSSPVLQRKPKASTDSFAVHDGGYNSSGSETEEISDDDDDESIIFARQRPQEFNPTVRVSLKNQHLFDQEGHASVPLLDLVDAPKYKLYRATYANLLAQWGLHTAQAEVLKFNGLTPYYLGSVSSSETGHTWSHSRSFGVDVAPSARPSVQFQLTPIPDFREPRNGTYDVDSPNRPLNPTAPEFVPTPSDNSPMYSDLAAPSLKSVLSNIDLGGNGFLSVPGNANTHHGQHSSGHHHISEKAGTHALQRGFSTGNSSPSLLRTSLNTLHRHEIGTDPTEKLPVEQRICFECWEVVQGLHVLCVSGEHRAHRECIRERDQLKRDWDDLSVMGLGCPCDKGADWTETEVDTFENNFRMVY